ncbi:ATP-binding protein [Candidatus Latescibacterota bacterium]
MSFSSVTKIISSRLAARLILVVILLLCIVSVILSAFIIRRQKTLLTHELNNRMESLARNLAYDSSHHLAPLNVFPLTSLVASLKDEPDILNAILTGKDGSIIISSVSNTEEKTISIPVELASGKERQWYPAETRHVKRLFVPIDRDVPLIFEQEGDKLFSFSERLSRQFSESSEIVIPYSGYFPRFRNDNVITFNSSFGGAKGVLGACCITLDDLRFRFMPGPARIHVVWSKNGSHNVFVNMDRGAISYHDTMTGNISDVYHYNIPVPIMCFTPDNNDIITTFAPKVGDEKLFRIPCTGGVLEQLTFHDGRHWWPSCSPDGNWIMYTVYNKNIIHVYNTITKKSIHVIPELKDLVWGGSISPDGKQFCYNRYIGGGYDVFVADFYSERENPVDDGDYGSRITWTGGHKTITDWSPDGSLIAYPQSETLDNKYPTTPFVVSSDGSSDPINLFEVVESQRVRIGYALLEVSFEGLNRAIRKSNYVALVITLISTSVGAISAAIMVMTIVRPVRRLSEAVSAVAEGEYGKKVMIQRNDEIGMLANSFNHMTGRLRIAIEEIETRNTELEKAYRELETLDKAKDDFLSLVSHELRTPLGSMLLSAEMLLDNCVHSEEKKSQYHENIVRQCMRLTRLVNDVLDLSKIEAGRLLLTFEVLSLRMLLSDVFSTLSPLLDKKKLEYDYDAVPGDIFLKGDRDKIIQVMTNIITNSIKFTPGGGKISITLTRDGTMGTVAVTDTGRGIPEEDIPKVFDRFSQLENIDHHEEGTGLGMPIAKSIIDLHGGTIRIDSNPGKGTTVFFTLPVADALTDYAGIGTDAATLRNSISHQNEAQATSETILVVDDEKSYRETITDCVRLAGFDTLEAVNGREALRMVEKHKPTLIILDVMMPDMSGIEVCRYLREQPGSHAIKIIMLSARGQEMEKEEGIKAGADRYITKPFNYSNLLETIEELIGE